MEHIETFSKAGLRTLIIGAKALAGPEYEAWAQRYRSAELSLYNRAEKLASVAADIEVRRGEWTWHVWHLGSVELHVLCSLRTE